MTASAEVVARVQGATVDEHLHEYSTQRTLIAAVEAQIQNRLPFNIWQITTAVSIDEHLANIYMLYVCRCVLVYILPEPAQ